MSVSNNNLMDFIWSYYFLFSSIVTLPDLHLAKPPTKKRKKTEGDDDAESQVSAEATGISQEDRLLDQFPDLPIDPCRRIKPL